MSCLADAETPHQVEDINYIMTNLASLLAFEWGAAGPQFWLKRCYAAGLADEGARSQEMWAASRRRKRQRNGFSPKSSRRNAACWHLDFRTLGLQDCKMIWVTFSCYKFMIIYYRSNKKLIQNTWKHLSAYWFMFHCKVDLVEELEAESGIQGLS